MLQQALDPSDKSTPTGRRDGVLIPKMFLVIRLQSSAPVSMTWLVFCVTLISVPRKGGELDFCITIADELALDRCFVACEGGKLHRGHFSFEMPRHVRLF